MSNEWDDDDEDEGFVEGDKGECGDCGEYRKLECLSEVCIECWRSEHE